jgi:predicted transcriptional regulator
MTIIDRILDKGHSLKDVATSMNVNMSTCKAIIKVYQEEGRVGKKKKRNKVYNVIETFSFFYLQGDNIEQIGDVKIQESKVSLEKEDNFDEVLQENARARAEELLEQVVAEKKQ